jgi:HSP20 family protein
MRREMNQMFRDFFRGLEPFDEEGGAFTPRVNVTESDAKIEATVELPGLSEENIDLTLTRDGLVIEGEKKAEKEEEGKSYHRRERSYGYFRRTIPLPPNVVDQDKVEADFDRGVLTVTLPKREEAQPVARRIPVKSG